MVRRGVSRATEVLLPLAAAAAALALVAPSSALAERSDLVLAALVLFTSLGIQPGALVSLYRRPAALLALVVFPSVVLAPLGWLVSQLFSGAVSDGVLALGISSTEVAAVGLVAIAGGSAALALVVLTGSLVLAALGGPLLLGALAGADADVAAGELVGRFSLVVLVPFAVGLIIRAASSALDRAEPELAGLATVTVVVLVYAAMSGAGDDGDLVAAAAASGLFLAAAAVVSRLGGAGAAGATRDRGARDRATRLRRCCRPGEPGVRSIGGDGVRGLWRADAVVRRRRGSLASAVVPAGRCPATRSASDCRARARAGGSGRVCPRCPTRPRCDLLRS